MAAWWPYQIFTVSGWHSFGSVTQVCFGISFSNFMCMSFVAVGRSLTIVSYVAFKIAALWFWTMFNCNPPIAHCHPLLWGGGILVDHWSTISSSIWILHAMNEFPLRFFNSKYNVNMFILYNTLFDIWRENNICRWERCVFRIIFLPWLVSPFCWL